MRCPSFLWFFVQVKLGQNLPCPVVMARQGKAEKSALPCNCGYVWRWQGRTNMLCFVTLWFCVPYYSLVLCSLRFTHTHTRDADALEQWRRQLWQRWQKLQFCSTAPPYSSSSFGSNGEGATTALLLRKRRQKEEEEEK
jgi:hypothetical protein